MKVFIVFDVIMEDILEVFSSKKFADDYVSKLEFSKDCIVVEKEVLNLDLGDNDELY